MNYTYPCPKCTKLCFHNEATEYFHCRGCNAIYSELHFESNNLTCTRVPLKMNAPSSESEKRMYDKGYSQGCLVGYQQALNDISNFLEQSKSGIKTTIDLLKPIINNQHPHTE